MASAILQRSSSTVTVSDLGVEYIVTNLTTGNKLTSDGSTKFIIDIGSRKFKGNFDFSTSDQFTIVINPDHMSAIDATGIIEVSFDSGTTKIAAGNYYIRFDVL